MSLGMHRENQPDTRRTGLRRAVLCLSGLLLLNTSCYHYRVSGQNVAATEAKRATLWSTVWGLQQQNVNTEQPCLGNPIAEVTASTNFGYALLTVISLGFVAPVEVEWTCAKDQPPGGRGNVGNDF